MPKDTNWMICSVPRGSLYPIEDYEDLLGQSDSGIHGAHGGSSESSGGMTSSTKITWDQVYTILPLSSSSPMCLNQRRKNFFRQKCCSPNLYMRGGFTLMMLTQNLDV